MTLILVKPMILILVKLKILIILRLKIKMKTQTEIGSYRCLDIQSDEKVKKAIGEKNRSFGSFGMTIKYQNYVRSGYALMVTIYTQGLKSFAHVLVKYFLLENIRQPYQEIKQAPT